MTPNDYVVIRDSIMLDANDTVTAHAGNITYPLVADCGLCFLLPLLCSRN